MTFSKAALIARARELQHRADALARSVPVAATREQIALVALAAGDVQIWLIEVREMDAERLSAVAHSLESTTATSARGVGHRGPPWW